MILEENKYFRDNGESRVIFYTDALSLPDNATDTKLKLSLRDIFVKCRRYPRVLCKDIIRDSLYVPEIFILLQYHKNGTYILLNSLNKCRYLGCVLYNLMYHYICLERKRVFSRIYVPL